MSQTVKIAMTLRALIDEARALLRRNGGVRSLLSLSSALLNTILKSIVIPLVVIAFISLHQAHAKPFTFNFPARFSLASLVSGAAGGAGGAERRAAAGVKPYTGLRVSNETLRMIYWFDQTVAVVELGPEKLLLNCELIEVFDDADGKRLLEQLSKINRPLEITFEQMMKLMQQCQQVLPSTVEGVERLRVTRAEGAAARAQLDAAGQSGGGILAGGSPLSLLSGIIPGTKWCGTGDIATTYHDLGADKRMDRCCRTHDLCPTKVRAFSMRYNLTNNSLYSKSHCFCDDVLFSCLKATNTSASEVMGNIYFNLVQVPCLEEAPSGDVRFRRAKQGF